jgi:hypothetical protein
LPCIVNSTWARLVEGRVPALLGALPGIAHEGGARMGALREAAGMRAQRVQVLGGDAQHLQAAKAEADVDDAGAQGLRQPVGEGQLVVIEQVAEEGARRSRVDDFQHDVPAAVEVALGRPGDALHLLQQTRQLAAHVLLPGWKAWSMRAAVASG